MRPTAMPAIAVLVFALAAPLAAEYPWPKPESFDVELAPVGDSEVTGTAHLVLRGDRLTVLVSAFGLDPTKLHPLIIHGFPSGRSSICPDTVPAVEVSSALAADDVRSVFGFGLLGLDPSPKADRGGIVGFEHSYEVDAGAIAPLSRRTLVLYHESGIPLACGEIRGYLTG